MDRFSALTLLHEEAIYIHQGTQYQVEELDWEEKKAYVTEVMLITLQMLIWRLN